MTRKPQPRSFDYVTAAAIRRNIGMSQAELARAVGMSISSVKMWELGQRQPDLATTVRIAHALGVSVDILRAQLPDLDNDDLAMIRTKQRLSAADIGRVVGQSERTVKRVEDGERLPDDPDLWASAYHLSLVALAAAWRRGGRSRPEPPRIVHDASGR